MASLLKITPVRTASAAEPPRSALPRGERTLNVHITSTQMS